ncbi:MAG: hypothetical protein PHE43_01520 [Candidatus Nanoarchaeia archaeon]|nr:hypothetical protein [Candidatus Nanoarchaeia archaeon]
MKSTEKIADSLEKFLVRLQRANSLIIEREKHPVLKSQVWELARMFIRVIFYFLLIFGGYLLTTLPQILKSKSLFFGFALYVILLIVMYEVLIMYLMKKLKCLLRKLMKPMEKILKIKPISKKVEAKNKC